jgi:DNA-binding transcriptional regulator YhcF (GntR family)
MKFALDFESDSPLHRQLEEQVLYAISLGELRPGDRLPSIRELERVLGVNRNTVRRTYLDLKAKGTIVMRRGQVAQIAEQIPTGSGDGDDLGDIAEELAVELIRRCEASGLDALQFARYHTGLVREHDAQHPRYAFAECNDGMAEAIAHRIGEQLGRRVVPVNLGAEHAAAELPHSVRCILVPHWHVAETRELMAERSLRVIQLELRLDPDCVARLNALASKRVIVVVRDAESAPGYRELVRNYVGDGQVEVALGDTFADSSLVIDDFDCVVYTTPCSAVVRSRAGTSRVVELVFEPSPDALRDIDQQMFKVLEPRARLAAG